MTRLLRLAIALDQVANVLAGGHPDETLSARAYRLRAVKRTWRLAYRTINTVFWWQADHCAASYEAERLRHHLPPEYRPR